MMTNLVTDFSARDFRDVLSHFCTGLTVITAVDGDQPVGFVCQSFQSVSLDPPLVSFAPAKTSSTWPRIRRANRFAVNVLAADQGELCARFAKPGGDKFIDLAWQASPEGSPILDGVLAWIDCKIVRSVEAGDHDIVLGRVLDLAADSSADPLLFFRGALSQMAAAT
jgi:3-hydroxy-9,10-secoandrosta-1,3,5(10)-triene-9,17-dione monooxygenase reductase component